MRKEIAHDFKAPIEKTSVGLAQVILQNYIENLEYFVYEDNEESRKPEYVANIEEKTIDFAIRCMALMATTDIPADYATYPIDKIIAGLQALKIFIDGSLRQNADELLARTIGARSPVTNTYAKDCATMGELMLALKRVREETGNNDADYFIPKPTPEPEVTPELSPTETPIHGEGEE